MGLRKSLRKGSGFSESAAPTELEDFKESIYYFFNVLHIKRMK